MKAPVRRYVRNSRRRGLWRRIVSAFACIVVFVTTYALLLPAITLEKSAACGLEEHQHTDACYEEQLVCGQEKAEGHHHTDACFTASRTLLCTKNEHFHTEDCYDKDGNLTCALEAHSHSDDCFETDRILSCHLEEKEGHTHTAACYQKILICGKQVHTHSPACFVEEEEAAEDATKGTTKGTTKDVTEETMGDAAEDAAEDTAGDPAEDAAEEVTKDVNARGTAQQPVLDPVNLAEYLTGDTSAWYKKAGAGEYDWQKVTDRTELEADDIVRFFFAYSIPAGLLNGSNPQTRFTLPDSILLTDAQIEELNRFNDGRGAWAVQGIRTPDTEPVSEEYVSAWFRLENIYEKEKEKEKQASRPLQEVVLTFDALTIGKNQNIYDTDGKILRKGQTVNGFFLIDVNTGQIDFEKISDETLTETVETEEGLLDRTIEVLLSEAEVVLAQPQPDAVPGSPAADGIRTRIRLRTQSILSEKLRPVEEPGAEDPAAEEPAREVPAEEASVGEGSDVEEPGAEAPAREDSAAGMTGIKKIEEADPAAVPSDHENPEGTISAGTLTFEGSDYTVTASYDRTAGIPSGAALSVKEITPDQKDYQTYCSQAEEAAETAAKAAGEPGGETISWVRLFDISIVRDGETVEPEGPVSVQITYHEPVELGGENAGVKTVHFEGDEETPRVLDTEADGSGTAVEKVTFDTDSFSVFAIVGTTIEKTVLASDGQNYRITATYGSETGIPENAELEVYEILPDENGDTSTSSVYGMSYEEYVAYTENVLGMDEGSAGYIRLFDIKIVDKDDHSVRYQPAEETKVDVRIELADVNGGNDLKVVHFADGSETGNVIAAETDNRAVLFTAEGFSIYAVVDGQETGEHARIGYRFWYHDGTQSILLSTQYFRYKDVHPATGDALTINEPGIPGVETATWNRIFRGWSKTGFDDNDENLTTVETLNTELTGFNQSDYVEGTYIDLYANLKNVYYVTYVDINPNNVLATEIVPVAETGDTTFNIKPATELRPAIDSDTVLEGWYDINNPDTVYVPGQENVALGSNLTLYPKVEGGNWLIFNDNDLVDNGSGTMVSGGASFTPPAFYLDAVTEAPDDPVWTGYEFGGWYTDAACTTPFEFGGTLTHDTTVYAKWIPSDSSYRVIIWKQRTSDDPDTPDAQKTYDYVTSDLYEDVVTGETVTLADSYKKIYGTNGTSTDTDKGYFTYNAGKTDQNIVVKADGSSVLNVYYDRKPVTLNYYTWDYGYTVTTGNNGTQFGLVDGQYVQLTRSGNNPNYSWTYVSGTEYVYNRYTGSASGNYYIPDGEGGYEYIYLYRNNNRWYRSRTWDWGWNYSEEYTGEVYTRTETNITSPYAGTRYTRNNSRSWNIYKTFTGLYGSTLEENGYVWPEEYDWYSNGGNNGTTSGTRTTFMSSFLPTEVNTSGNTVTVNFYGSSPSGNYYIHFLTQNLDGSYTEKDTVAASGRSFYISDKYIGYHAYQYRADNGNWNSVGTKNNNGYYNNGNTVSFTNNLYIRFNLTDYTLSFYTNNGSNQLVTYTVPYSKSLAEYAGQNQGQKEGYYFLGWYADPSCTEPFDFSQTMPDNNVAVYGKWRMRRIRVVIDSGAGNVNMGSQAAQFRLDYDERIDGGLMESATRAGYILDGWYTDPEFTNRFLFSSPINDDTTDVAWDYQTSQQWAAERAAYGDDTENYENVRGILHLYAKWIPDPNSTGINVLYDPGDAAIYDSLGNLLTTVPVDSHMYGFDGTATAREAPSNYSDLYTFKYWEGILEDGTTKIFYPSDPVTLADLMPSETIYDDTSGEELRHTVTLRAVYDLTGDPDRQTTITYDGNTFHDILYNGETSEMKGRANDGTERVTFTLDKEVNQNIELPAANDFYLNGWELVGWSFTEGTYEEQVAAATAEAPNFLPGQTVAADNLIISALNNEENTLYAMWQPKTYTVTVKQVIEDGVPDHSFTYPYRTGAENVIDSSLDVVETLSNNSSFTVDNLGYYNRTGDVIRITPPTVPDTASYSVRVNAVVTHDDGTTEILNPTAAGDYQILGDVVITYTYSPKVLVRLQKRDATNHGTVLTGAEFTFTPVEFNTITNHWENAGSGTSLTVNVVTLQQYLQEGTYRITETGAPENYASIGTELFLTVDKDKAFTLFTASGGAVNAEIAELDDETGKVLTVYDNPIRTVTLHKTVEDEGEGDFPFRITVFSSNDSRLGGYTVGELGGTSLVTNNVGEVTVALRHGENIQLKLPHGCKLMVEEALHSKYEASYVWNDEEAVESRIFGNEGAPVSITADGTLTYTNKRSIQKLRIKKIGNDAEKGLADATFSLTAVNVDGFNDMTGITSLDGTAVSENLGYLPGNDDTDTTLFVLPVGIYTLSETKAPAYYDGLSGNVTLTVEKNGITLSRENDSDTVDLSEPADGVYTLTLTNNRKLADVTVIKNVVGTDIDQDAQYSFTATGLTEGDDVFTLHGRQLPETMEEGETPTQVNTRVYRNIPQGTGFAVIETGTCTDFDTDIMAVYVDSDGLTQVIALDPDRENQRSTGNLIVEGDVTITYTNTRNAQPVKVFKYETGTTPEHPLAGAVFSLTGPDGSGISYSNLTTNSEGYLVNGDGIIFQLPVHNGTFTLTETQAPAGYLVIGDGKKSFTVSTGIVTGAEVETETNGGEEVPTGVYIIKVQNSAGYELPSTGGPGTGTFAAFGCILTIFAGALLLQRRRMYFDP